MSRIIHFFNEDTNFLPKQRKLLSNWILAIFQNENKHVEYVNFIFCSNTYLLKLNLEYLQHDTLTDIITFQYNKRKEPIASDIYISIEMCKENAKDFDVPYTKELHRLLAHGSLHLIGYKDKSKTHKLLMTQKEDYYLSLRPEELSV